MAKPKKTVCPITRDQFDAAKPVTVVVNGIEMTAPPKRFSTGSLGWYLNGKTTIDVGGVAVPVQIGMNLTIVGSKELPGPTAEPAAAESPDAEPEAEPVAVEPAA